MSSEPLADIYPADRTISEARRLQAQHDLLVDALGGIILCPLDRSASGLRILDVGGADGYLLEQLRLELKDPESAYLVGTDIKPYPENRPGVEMRIHDFRTPFPEEWKDSFDLVSIRNCLAGTGSDKAAVDLIRRLLDLVKPGTGWLHIVDGWLPTGPVRDRDSSFLKITKTIGNALVAHGMDASIGARVAALLPQAVRGNATDLGNRSAPSPIGKGCKPELEETGYDEIRGLVETAGKGLEKAENPPLTYDEFRELGVRALQEVKERGVTMQWYAAWARRV